MEYLLCIVVGMFIILGVEIGIMQFYKFVNKINKKRKENK